MSTEDQPPVLPNPREEGWIKRAPGDVIEAGTPYVKLRPTTGSIFSAGAAWRFTIMDDCGITYWTPPPASPEPWERISTDRERPTLARVTWTNPNDGDRRSQTARVHIDGVYVCDEWDNPIGQAKHATAVELLHTHNPDTHVPVERALIDEAAAYVASRESTLPGNWVPVPTHIIKSLAALADGGRS